MSEDQVQNRVFLFLQGPHGPFFYQLSKMLTTTGADALRVGFNAGDRAFWPNSHSYIPYRGTVEDWPKTFRTLIKDHRVTDIVLYGDTRPIHAKAIKIAEKKGLTIHVFEEGYMRPYWATYERGGSNGHSRLMDMSVSDMEEALLHSEMESPLPPAAWGDTRQHIFYGALYHSFVLLWNRGYRNFKPHRDITVRQEFLLYLQRLLLLPTHAIGRRLATARIRYGGFPYHLVLLQLEHDSAFQKHSPYETTADFLRVVCKGFAEGAPKYHHLVFKAHPLEDGRVPIHRTLEQLTKEFDLTGRVHFVRGGKLARLLGAARSAVTVNSTAAMQVLWRGIPLRSFGAAVYDKPEFVSKQPISNFFEGASRPNNRAYKIFRRYLLETSQVPGGYYSARGRRRLRRQVVDMMLAIDDPYAALSSGEAAPRQQLRVVN